MILVLLLLARPVLGQISCSKYEDCYFKGCNDGYNDGTPQINMYLQPLPEIWFGCTCTYNGMVEYTGEYATPTYSDWIRSWSLGPGYTAYTKYILEAAKPTVECNKCVQSQVLPSITYRFEPEDNPSKRKWHYCAYADCTKYGFCPPGQIYNLQCECVGCPGGHYCNSNKKYPCRTCVAPEVQIRACTATENTVCQAPQAEQFWRSTGDTDHVGPGWQDCRPRCPPGQWETQTCTQDAYHDRYCQPCLYGHYCPGDRDANDSPLPLSEPSKRPIHCTLCPAGKVIVGGCNSIDRRCADCAICPSGQYAKVPCSSEGGPSGTQSQTIYYNLVTWAPVEHYYDYWWQVTTDTTCAACFPASCQPNEYEVWPCAHAHNRRCSACPQGNYCNGLVAKVCEPGYFCVNGVRSACGAGQFSYEANSSCTPCSIAPDGMYCSSSTVRQCEAGFFCVGGERTACPLNHFSTGSNASCSMCLDGYMCTNGLIKSCNAGSKCIGNVVTSCVPGISTNNATACAPCPGASYSSSGIACGTCPPGSYQTGSTCTLCEQNYYCRDGVRAPCTSIGYWHNNDLPGQSFCHTCAGPYHWVPGIWPAGTCVKCTQGQVCPKNRTVITCPDGYVADEFIVNCVKCPNGKYPTLPRGAALNYYRNPYFFDYYCQDCPLNTYCVNGINKSCVTPEFNGFTLYTGATSCSNCPPPYYYEKREFSNGCQYCLKDHYCYNGRAHPCVPPAYAPEEQGYCNCPSGMAIMNRSTCVPCPAGSYCPTEQAVSCAPGA